MFLIWERIADRGGQEEGFPVKGEIPKISDILMCK